MPENIRALVVIFALAVPAFYVARQLAGPVIAPREFTTWRNAWFAATAAGFLSGNIFLYAGMTALICLYAHGARAATPAMFFVLLFVVPMAKVPIGGFGVVNWLFDLNNARLLALVLLLPILFTTKRSGRGNGAYSTPDWLVAGYALLYIARQLDAFDIAHIMRAVTVVSLDVLIPYFAFSRAVGSVADLRKVLLAFVVAVLPLTLIAMFETVKVWHVYGSIMAAWGDNSMGYLKREGMLRASASAITPIALGYLNMVAIGCLLAIWRPANLPQKFARLAFAMFAVGLVVTLSRGPWVGAAVLVLTFLAIGPKAAANLGRFAVAALVGVGVLLVLPIGQQLLDLLPFVGTTTAEGSVAYRQRLFDNALIVMARNPWLGDTNYRAAPEMLEMIQGEGIIDVVNTYINIALSYGLVGLGLFAGAFASILIGLRRVIKFRAVQDNGVTVTARALMATLIAVLATIATVSSVDTIPYVYWSLAGLCVACIRIAYRERVAVARGALKQIPA